jgi:hypothetical protein
MTAACGYCGADPEAPVARRWAFFLDRQPPSLNARVFNAGAKRWAYARERDGWVEEVWIARVSHRIAQAKGKRRVIVVRHYAGREKERDYVNLVGGCKALIDALVLERLLVDDTPAYLEDHYKQLRTQRSGVEIVIEDLS